MLLIIIIIIIIIITIIIIIIIDIIVFLVFLINISATNLLVLVLRKDHLALPRGSQIFWPQSTY